ncbi:capsule-associated protein CAP1 [Physocladia obscura]|uniref:Capsule-associated protein CAP1 n=1 Tax=Physocladia obscura TaxID=109957 RepID=A0AAD5X9D9_9FUNG|nr:capsule-associated protein CAP1 [Physocladia obscura]
MARDQQKYFILVLVGMMIIGLYTVGTLQPSSLLVGPNADVANAAAEVYNMLNVSYLPLDRYEQVFGRKPPPTYKEFIKFATEKQCGINLLLYMQIYRDLEPWFRVGKITPNDFPAIDEFFNLGIYENKTLSNKGGTAFNEADPGHYSFLKPAVHILDPNKPFKYVVSWQDEPIALPTNREIGETAEAYADISDAFNQNSCFRNAYGYSQSRTQQAVRNVHGALISPHTFTFVNKELAVFSQNKLKCFRDLIIPLRHHGWNGNDVVNNVDWADKLNVLFWRGGSTGGSHYEHSSWRSFHRIRLLEWEYQWRSKNPEAVFDAGIEKSYLISPVPKSSIFHKQELLVDIGLNQLFQIYSDKIQEAIITRYGIKKHVNFDEFQHFKYLLVVDGNAWPARLQTFLKSNSLVLYTGIYRDYFNGLLEPWVHYVPVNPDLSDLLDKVKWAMANDDAARKITENAQLLMKLLGSTAQMQCHTALMFLEYQQLYQDA